MTKTIGIRRGQRAERHWKRAYEPQSTHAQDRKEKENSSPFEGTTGGGRTGAVGGRKHHTEHAPDETTTEEGSQRKH